MGGPEFRSLFGENRIGCRLAQQLIVGNQFSVGFLQLAEGLFPAAEPADLTSKLVKLTGIRLEFLDGLLVLGFETRDRDRRFFPARFDFNTKGLVLLPKPADLLPAKQGTEQSPHRTND